MGSTGFSTGSHLHFEIHPDKSVVNPMAYLPSINVTPPMVVGVGNVGKKSGEATYTLYNPNTNQVESKTVRYGVNKGFGGKKTTVKSN